MCSFPFSSGVGLCTDRGSESWHIMRTLTLDEMPCELRKKDAKIGKQGCREVLGYQQVSGNKPRCPWILASLLSGIPNIPAGLLEDKGLCS